MKVNLSSQVLGYCDGVKNDILFSAECNISLCVRVCVCVLHARKENLFARISP